MKIKIKIKMAQIVLFFFLTGMILEAPFENSDADTGAQFFPKIRYTNVYRALSISELSMMGTLNFVFESGIDDSETKTLQKILIKSSNPFVRQWLNRSGEETEIRGEYLVSEEKLKAALPGLASHSSKAILMLKSENKREDKREEKEQYEGRVVKFK
ncbi:MAG TPA: hypothetical protein PLY23_08625 [Alphaproteobacteria bacterium]|nr:hypothetical protein [Alphaproteobacteria bacterium]HQS94705.1 hypothetical protein [Alphaproteobacteria bacterium]